MRYVTLTVALAVVLMTGVYVGFADAQEVYRWTDEQGKVHFGNMPPPNSKNVQSDGQAPSQAELDCEGAARRECERNQKRLKAYSDAPSSAARDCIQQHIEQCTSRQRMRKTPSTPNQRTLVTARVKFDPATGDQLVCQMTCTTECKGTLEIWDTANLVRGENPGAKEYSVRVTPKVAGSAYCRSTVNDPSSSLVLTLVRDGIVVSSLPAR